MASDTKPASPSSVPHRKTEFLFQADDQATYEQWKSRLEKVTRPSEENVVSFIFSSNPNEKAYQFIKFDFYSNRSKNC